MRVKNAIKRLVALGTGAAMLGATIMGAAAYDLGDYPAPFVKNGVFGGKIVVGVAASSSDILGALDIAISLQRAASTPVSISSSTVSVSDGDTEEIALGSNIVSGGMDATYTYVDLSVLQDTNVDVNGTEVKVHDEIVLSSTSTYLDVVTSLSNSYEDYETDVFLEVGYPGAMKYCYVFDSAINLATEVSSDEPLEIEFLGQDLKITTINSAMSITAQVGKEVFLGAGDSTVVEGKTVTLDRTSSTSAVVTVDGKTDVIREGQTKTVNGIRIKVVSVFDDDGIEFDSATLVIGTDAVKTYVNGDPFIGEDKTDYNWEWVLGSLTSTSGQELCVKNHFVYTNDEDKAKKVGEYYTFPNNFVDIGIASLKVTDDNYMSLTVDYRSSNDLSYGGGGYSDKAIRITASEDRTLNLLSAAFTNGISENTKTKELYLVVGTLTGAQRNVEVYYKNPNDSNRIAFAGNITGHITATNTTTFLQVDYGKTKLTDMQMKLYGAANETIYLSLFPSTPATDALWMKLMSDGSDFLGFGATARTEEAAELLYGHVTVPGSAGNIGTQEKDQLTKYGVKVSKPKSAGASDKYVFYIPNDQQKANVVVKSGSASVGGGSAGSYDKINPIAVGMGILDRNANLGGATPYIVVGGPCANTVAFDLMGSPANCLEGFTAGEAKVKWFENKNALLVAGFSPDDTVGACRVVANYDDYATGFAPGVSEFKVLVPTLSSIRIETI